MRSYGGPGLEDRIEDELTGSLPAKDVGRVMSSEDHVG